MMNYKQIDESIAQRLNNIGSRLYTLKYVLNFYVYCIEENIFSDSELELTCLGTVICDFLDITKSKYNDLESELRI